MIALGYFPGQPNGNDANAMAAYKANIAADVALLGPQSLIGVFEQAVGQNPGTMFWSVKQAGSNGLRVVDGVPMRSGASNLQTTINGGDDAYYRGIVQAAKSNAISLLDIRLGYEPDVPYMASQVSNVTDAAAFVKAFQHLYGVLHDEATKQGVTVRVGFNPAMIHDFPVSPKLMYPGNAYVDVLMLDIYSSIANPGNFYNMRPDYSGPVNWTQVSQADWIANPDNRRMSWMHHPGNAWNWTGISGAGATLTPDWTKTTQGWSFAEHVHFAVACGKPIAIPETGCGPVSNGMLFVPDDAAFPAWLAESLKWAQSLGVTVDYVNIWDINPGDGNWKFSGGAQPNVAAGWAAEFGATRDLTIYLSEDAYKGDAVVGITVNGVPQPDVTVKSLHSAGVTQPVIVKAVKTGSSIVVTFKNDLCAQRPDGTYDGSLGDRNAWFMGAAWGSVDLELKETMLGHTGDKLTFSV